MPLEPEETDSSHEDSSPGCVLLTGSLLAWPFQRETSRGLGAGRLHAGQSSIRRKGWWVGRSYRHRTVSRWPTGAQLLNLLRNPRPQPSAQASASEPPVGGESVCSPSLGDHSPSNQAAP